MFIPSSFVRQESGTLLDPQRERLIKVGQQVRRRHRGEVCYLADVPFLRVSRRMDMTKARERLIDLALQEVLHIGHGKLLLFLRTGLHHGSFPAR